MSLVVVAGLGGDRAKVEIEATAYLRMNVRKLSFLTTIEPHKWAVLIL